MISQGNTEKNPNTLLISPELKEAQNLMPMSEADRSNLKNDIEKNGMRHPVIAYRKEGGYYILAGWNRWEIAIELNIPLVEVQIIEGNPEEYKSFVITENLSRRHLTVEQKGELIKYLLKADSSKSNGVIAKTTGSSKSTVQTKRIELENCGKIPVVVSVKGSDGKDYIKKTGVQIGQLKTKDIPVAQTFLENKPIDFHETDNGVFSNNNDILNSIRDHLNNQIKLEKEKISKVTIDVKLTPDQIKTEARIETFYEVLDFIKKIEVLECKDDYRLI